MKFVENARSSLVSLLTNKNPWAGSVCVRKDCFPCKQGGEKMEPCTQKNVVYESKCVTCIGKEKGKEEGSLSDTRDDRSIYVGESSRNLQERALEHHKDYREVSHQVTYLHDTHNEVAHCTICTAQTCVDQTSS